MKRLLSLITGLALVFTCGAQVVSNIRFEKQGNIVRLYYDLSEDADVSIYLSKDSGRTYGSKAIGHVYGDVGPKVPAGKNKCVLWDAVSDNEQLKNEDIQFKIMAEKRNANKTITVGGVSFTMVYVEGGTFTMGCTTEQDTNCNEDEYPPHNVTLSDFYIGEVEVTQELWEATGGEADGDWLGKDLPVYWVTWNTAMRFVEIISKETGLNFRLPSEAEWEFAARGGNKSKGYKYSGSNNIDDVAWYNQNSGGKPHPVKQKKPNELGIFDMSGNIVEWCSDAFGKRYYKVCSQYNPQGPPVESDDCFMYGFSNHIPSMGFMDESDEDNVITSVRVQRGGNWKYHPYFCRNTCRGRCNPDYMNDSGDGHFELCGLRLVLDVE